MRKIFIFQLLVILIISVSSAQDSNNIKDQTMNIKLESVEDALSRTLVLTGFGNFMKVRLSKSSAENYVKKIVIEKDSTAFLSSQIEGKELWQVIINDVDIRPEYSRTRGYNYWRRKSFNILLDPNSGRLIKINSVPMVTDSICTLLYTAEERTVYLKNQGEEYHGFPQEAPNVSFRDALIAAVGCKPLIANEISAQYVLYSEFGSEPKPVWSITSLGIPPLHFTSKGENSSDPDVSLECYKCIVDAMSGKWESVSLVPCNPPEMTKHGEKGGE